MQVEDRTDEDIQIQAMSLRSTSGGYDVFGVKVYEAMKWACNLHPH